MSPSVPHNISDNTITFFAKGRPFEVSKSHKGFDAVRTTLLGWRSADRTPADVDALIAIADPKVELMAASGGQLTFVGNDIVYGGSPLHNLWVDKILGFKDAGENFDPIFLALQDLQKNPTPAARERLPIFVERSKLGFLPDGRIAAFKGVRGDYMDVHSGTVHYGIGKTVSIPRESCNANPDQTCVAGLHLGAIDYIKENGYGWGSDRRLLLCAFWPRHVVAVPTDYKGGKMRVESMEVLDEVDRKFVDDLLSNGTLIVRGYDTPSTPAAPAAVAEAAPAILADWQKAKVGDWIEVEDDSNLADGFYFVVSVDDDNENDERVTVRTGSQESAVQSIDNNSVVDVTSDVPVWFTAKVGDWVKTEYEGIAEVVEVDIDALEGDESRLRIFVNGDEEWVTNDQIEKILDAPPAVWVRAREDDKIRVEGHPLFRDAVYTVYSIDNDDDHEEDESRLSIDVNSDGVSIDNVHIKSILREEEEAAAKGAAAATASAAVVTPVAASTEPAWKTAKVGDTITIKGTMRFPDGDYVVDRVDERNGMDRRLRVINSGSNWVDNEYVVGIVTPVTAAATPATDTRPLWEQVLAGDLIQVVGDNDVRDGNYIVELTDGSLTRGPRGVGIRVIVRGESFNPYIYNENAKRIIERDGKPFGQTIQLPAVIETPERDPQAYLNAKVGDVVVIKGSQYASDGTHKVASVDEGDNMRLYVEPELNWIRNEHIMQIVGTVEPVKEVWETISVGDLVRIEGSKWVSNGEFTVQDTSPPGGSESNYAFRASESRMWIEKTAVKAIIRKGAQLALPAPSTNSPAWLTAKVDDKVSFSGHASYTSGDYFVAKVNEGSDKRLSLYMGCGEYEVPNENVKAIVFVA